MLIKEYQESWKTDFEEIEKVILKDLDNLNVKIEHVGSTAVEDLAAKPIIDIDLIYFQTDDFHKVKTHLEQLGYDHVGDQGIVGREVFKRTENSNDSILDSIKHHLYVCHFKNEELKKHILFRDHLRQNQEARKKYADIKNKLAQEADQDKKKYAALKEVKAKKFINTCIENQRSNGK